MIWSVSTFVVGQDDRARLRTAEGVVHQRPHAASRGSVIAPVTAAAAAVSGLASSVRPPVPCRPSKLRLLVLTA